MASDVKNLFWSLQEQLAASLKSARSVTTHPGAKGDASEANWLALLESHLPNRYQINKAFILDSHGKCSDQIDVVIYDRQYTPLLYNKSGQLFIPAESVYAVFEVKQTLDRHNLEYAGAKAASVRRLNRTSTSIIHAGGKYTPRPLPPILAGILTFDGNWIPPLGDSLIATIQERPTEEQIDLGCVISAGSFDVSYADDRSVSLKRSDSSIALMSFFISLLDRLQSVGTVPAIDYGKYREALGF